jgi:hypothetical protein
METTGSLLMDNLLNLANVLYLFSYFVRDMLRLRLFTIVAASCLVVFFWKQPEPFWPGILWNVFFIALNLNWSVRILHDRWVERRRRRHGVASPRQHLHDFILPMTRKRLAGLRCDALLESTRNQGEHDPFWFVSF